MEHTTAAVGLSFLEEEEGSVVDYVVMHAGVDAEDLEFWRAAPEDALDWGEEEFGYQRGQGAPRPDADDELGAGAAGHLHAAGLRL